MKRIVFLTGAGISRESGLDTFRDAGGVWTKFRLEDVCTPEGFQRDPGLVDKFYNERRRELRNVEPNAAHFALAELEAAAGQGWDGEVLIITQNIDDLHERAGSHALLHMHGELNRLRCMMCEATPDWLEDGTRDTLCPACGAAAMRPDVVWFGEMPLHMERIQRALQRCDMFVAIGTSATVYPAAGFVAEAAQRAHTVELNLVPSGNAAAFDEGSYGPATTVVPRFVRDLLAG